jgi:signal transduction histidine kinase
MISLYAALKCLSINLLKWGYSDYNRILTFLIKSSFLTLLISSLLPYQIALLIVFIFLGFSAALALFVLIKLSIKSGNNNRNLLLLMLMFWVSFIIGSSTQISGEIGWVYHTHFINHGFLYGSLGMVLSLAFILTANIDKEHKEKIQTERELAIANDKLYQASKLSIITEMSTGLIHEIKNPLNWTKGSLSIAIEEFKNHTNDNDIEEMLDDAFKGIERIENIVNDLNWFAKSRELALSKSVNLNKVVTKTLSIAKSKCIHIKIEKSIADNINVLASETHLSQAIMNILSNSIKGLSQITDDREQCIVISGGYDEVKSRVFISWRDNGVGISKEKIKHLFDVWYRADNYSEGVGLGMTITKQIIDKHEGEISISSEEGSWTRVVIYLKQSE